MSYTRTLDEIETASLVAELAHRLHHQDEDRCDYCYRVRDTSPCKYPERHYGRQPVPASIDAAHLERQRRWSGVTFGPGPRTGGIIDHIAKELAEVEAAPGDLSEWVDIIILAFDGAWRSGHEPQEVIDGIRAKQARNEAREWPDWRDSSPDRAIEHIRTG